ncbi:uncharacterized protein [Lolium perenne]|uniref:uncharacterized protein isoform X2 n=1 Tax=Lolium perenne TaxID=4522 RepID=UPI003A9A4F95
MDPPPTRRTIHQSPPSMLVDGTLPAAAAMEARASTGPREQGDADAAGARVHPLRLPRRPRKLELRRPSPHKLMPDDHDSFCITSTFFCSDKAVLIKIHGNASSFTKTSCCHCLQPFLAGNCLLSAPRYDTNTACIKDCKCFQFLQNIRVVAGNL